VASVQLIFGAPVVCRLMNFDAAAAAAGQERDILAASSCSKQQVASSSWTSLLAASAWKSMHCPSHSCPVIQLTL